MNRVIKQKNFVEKDNKMEITIRENIIMLEKVDFHDGVDGFN